MKILIVEDDKSIAELEQDYLNINGFVCDIESDGEKALKKAIDGEYKLIILDVMLPSMTGFEFCSRYREKKDTPIIIISAKNEDIDKVRGLGIGADDYMTKPFSPNELVARVKNHIERYDKLTSKHLEKNEKNIIRVRNLKINIDDRRVFVDDEEKNMTAKEFEILLFLAENPNRVFTKEYIFDRIWSIDAIGDISTVTVHIRRLREKIENQDEQNKFIETVWGVGYRFRG